MTELSDENDQIALFMEISATDFETAKETLSINNFDLEQALNFHLERTKLLNRAEDDVQVSSGGALAREKSAPNKPNSSMATSTSTSLTAESLPNIPDEDDVRAPILPKREQMIMPNEDNFRYLKRRAVATRTVCPLRNFELEGRMQEERIQATVFGKLVDDDTVKEQNGPNFATISTASTPKSITEEASDDQRKFIQPNRNNSMGRAMPSRLSELFRPPVDISFCGSFQAAQDYAKKQNRWMIVNVQDNSDFNCQVLNRDIWSSEKLREVIKKHFVFWQVAVDNSDGHRFQVFYGINVFPYVGIIDPRTGEEKLSHKNGFKTSVTEFITELQDYLKANSGHPNHELAELENKPVEEIENFDEQSLQPSTSPNTNLNTSSLHHKNKRKRLNVEPSSLSEQEQIALAIGNSLREIAFNEADKSENSFGEEDIEFDDDYIGNSEDEDHTHPFSSTTNTISSAVTSKVEATAKKIETYESYLGDERDPKARIQLRLPNGDRHIFEWPCSSKLKALKLYIPFKYPELTTDNPYKIICPFVGGATTSGQPSNILDMDDVLTLKEANLYPTVILHVRSDD